MSISVSGKEIATTESGFLENVEDWSEEAARVLAAQEQLELGERHWDVIRHLREEYVLNGGNQPNTRNLVKAMARAWEIAAGTSTMTPMGGNLPSSPSCCSSRWLR